MTKYEIPEEIYYVSDKGKYFKFKYQNVGWLEKLEKGMFIKAPTTTINSYKKYFKETFFYNSIFLFKKVKELLLIETNILIF